MSFISTGAKQRIGSLARGIAEFARRTASGIGRIAARLGKWAAKKCAEAGIRYGKAAVAKLLKWVAAAAIFLVLLNYLLTPPFFVLLVAGIPLYLLYRSQKGLSKVIVGLVMALFAVAMLMGYATKSPSEYPTLLQAVRSGIST